jgi:hypothetical protein
MFPEIPPSESVPPKSLSPVSVSERQFSFPPTRIVVDE